MINQKHAILHYDMKSKCNCNGHSSHLLNMNMHIRLTLHIPFMKKSLYCTEMHFIAGDLQYLVFL